MKVRSRLPAEDHVDRRGEQTVFVLERPGIRVVVVAHFRPQPQRLDRLERNTRRRRGVQARETGALPLAIENEVALQRDIDLVAGTVVVVSIAGVIREVVRMDREYSEAVALPGRRGPPGSSE